MTRARRGWRRPSNPKGGFSPDDAGECVQGLRGAQASKRLPAPHRLRVAGELRPGEGLGCLQGLGASTLLEAGRGEEGARQSEAGRGPVRWLTALWSKAGSGHAPAAPLRGGLIQRRVGLPHAPETAQGLRVLLAQRRLEGGVAAPVVEASPPSSGASRSPWAIRLSASVVFLTSTMHLGAAPRKRARVRRAPASASVASRARACWPRCAWAENSVASRRSAWSTAAGLRAVAAESRPRRGRPSSRRSRRGKSARFMGAG